MIVLNQIQQYYWTLFSVRMNRPLKHCTRQAPRKVGFICVHTLNVVPLLLSCSYIYLLLYPSNSPLLFLSLCCHVRLRFVCFANTPCSAPGLFLLFLVVFGRFWSGTKKVVSFVVPRWLGVVSPDGGLSCIVFVQRPACAHRLFKTNCTTMVSPWFWAKKNTTTTDTAVSWNAPALSTCNVLYRFNRCQSILISTVSSTHHPISPVYDIKEVHNK